MERKLVREVVRMYICQDSSEIRVYPDTPVCSFRIIRINVFLNVVKFCYQGRARYIIPLNRIILNGAATLHTAQIAYFLK